MHHAWTLAAGSSTRTYFIASDHGRRIGEVSKLFADTGVVTLVSFISPYKADRERVRQRLQPGQFIEVFMKVPLAVCETRDPKGLYKKARAGISHSYAWGERNLHMESMGF